MLQQQGINMVKKTRFPVVSPEVRGSSVCTLNKAAERRQIISFKVPLRIVTLHDTVKGKKKEGHRSYKSLFAATTHSLLQFPLVTSFFFFLFSNPLLIFLPGSSVPLITTLWLALPVLWHRPRWASVAHFSQRRGVKLDTRTPTVVQEPRESASESFRSQILPFLFYKAQKRAWDKKKKCHPT